jgi:hypothetical protein
VTNNERKLRLDVQACGKISNNEMIALFLSELTTDLIAFKGDDGD